MPGASTPHTYPARRVDYLPMPTWKVFLIQFLNIAGIGPIFGAIMGVMFGAGRFSVDCVRHDFRRGGS